MRASPLLLVCLTLLGQEAPPRTFRQWVGDLEVGGSRQEQRQDGPVRELRSHEWMAISRLGQEIKQDLSETARKALDGSLSFTWRLQLSAEPFEGRAEWSPREPAVLAIQAANSPALKRDIPAGAILWPEELESRLKEAARTVQPLQATTFSFPIQQWSELHLRPQGKAPLPGFPDAVHFTGEERQGAASTAVEVWISPTAGEVRHQAELGGLRMLSQRAELPAPVFAKGETQGFFERSLQRLPPHPFQPWLPELALRLEGKPQDLPEDAQQTRLGKSRWRLRRAAAPTRLEATQPPVQGTPPAAEARYLSPSSLVPFQDPAFDGLLHRLDLPAGLSRWELAQRVNTFVFDWIVEKDFTVGFASALEVCHHPRGDCTEHGVLAVALLRRLGVPARGVTGWVALGETLGLHFWVEVRLRERWVPLDPTFDQAPASAFRIKLGDTDLADLGSVGWESAASAFSGARWIPEREGSRPYGEGITAKGDLVSGAAGMQLRLPGGRWTYKAGQLQLRTGTGGPWEVQTVTHPGEAQTRLFRHLAGAHSQRSGWWHPSRRLLWMDLGGGRWLQLEGVSETEAFDLLDQLLVPVSSS